jgi:hypothetical protein
MFFPALFGEDRLNPRELALRLPKISDVRLLSRHDRKTQIADAGCRFRKKFVEPFGRLASQFLRIHTYCFEMTAVLHGSLYFARVSASRALSAGMPSISNRIMPGFTSQT